MVRPKKLVFTNNKGGVGKTTLSFHVGVELALKGYKVAFVDLDPQCNLTLQALGHKFYDNTLFANKTIYDALKPKIDGSGDLDLTVEPMALRENLMIIPGDINLSLYEDLLINGYNEAASGAPRGYSDTSAINRYLDYIGSNNAIDIFIIDTSPSLGVLNRVIFLGSEYFAVPVTADSFSVQGVNNLGTVFSKWKRAWRDTAKATAVSGSIPANQVLPGDPLFIGYITNSFNVYADRKLRRQADWIDRIPREVKTSLSEKHGRNGLVEKSWKEPLGELQDIGQLTAISMENNFAVQEFEVGKTKELNLKGTKELHEKAKKAISDMTDKIINILKAY